MVLVHATEVADTNPSFSLLSIIKRKLSASFFCIRTKRSHALPRPTMVLWKNNKCYPGTDAVAMASHLTLFLAFPWRWRHSQRTPLSPSQRILSLPKLNASVPGYCADLGGNGKGCGQANNTLSWQQRSVVHNLRASDCHYFCPSEAFFW